MATVGGNADTKTTKIGEMKLILNLKHWQIFFIWILSIIVFAFLSNTDFYLIGFLIYMFSMIGWIFLIGRAFNKFNNKNRINNYRENIWFILWIISLIPFGYQYKIMETQNGLNVIILLIAGSIGFFSMIKTVNFAAKSYKQFEKGKELEFGDYFWDFLLIMYFIIGVWVIQPKLNKLIKK